MLTLTRTASILERVGEWRDGGQRIALVPTTGTLHKGHMSLVAEAQEHADHVIVSSFADSPPADGPTLEADRELLTNVGAEVLFMPPIQEMFPIGREGSVVVTLAPMAGAPDACTPERSASFLTVLIKLFNIVRPHVAVFGERDFQQLVMVRRLVDDLFIPIEIVGCATFREGDGLALASVNRHLTPGQRAVAPLLYAGLVDTAERLDAGERDYAALERRGLQRLTGAGFVPEHFVIRQAKDLAAVQAGTHDLVIIAAARLGGCRLSDSLPVAVIDRF